jgi:hypothetical protein
MSTAPAAGSAQGSSEEGVDARIRVLELARLREWVGSLLNDPGASAGWQEEAHEALTAGYAAAHVLETERLRLGRRFKETIEATDASPSEARDLLRQRQAYAEELEELRGLLARLRREASCRVELGSGAARSA